VSRFSTLELDGTLLEINNLVLPWPHDFTRLPTSLFSADRKQDTHCNLFNRYPSQPRTHCNLFKISIEIFIATSIDTL
jgi:hypothetical protein